MTWRCAECDELLLQHQVNTDKDGKFYCIFCGGKAKPIERIPDDF